jgi:hypothetical protein
MPASTYRVVDLSTYEVLIDVYDEGALATFLLNNKRYIVARVPMHGLTIIETNTANLSVPG